MRRTIQHHLGRSHLLLFFIFILFSLEFCHSKLPLPGHDDPSKLKKGLPVIQKNNGVDDEATTGSPMEEGQKEELKLRERTTETMADLLTAIITVNTKDSSVYLRGCLQSLISVWNEDKKDDQMKNKKLEIFVAFQGDHSPSEKHFMLDSLEFIIEQYKDQIPIKIKEAKREWKWAHSINDVIYEESKGEHILFLNEKTEILPSFFSSLFKQIHASSSSVSNIFGSKLIRSDGSLFHAGINFTLTKKPKKGGGGWWGSTNTEETNIAVPYFPLQGRSQFDKRAQHLSSVWAVSEVGALVPSQLFVNLGGIQEGYSTPLYSFLDFCLRVKEQSLKSDDTTDTTDTGSSINFDSKILFSPSTVALYHGDNPDVHDEQYENDINLFKDHWDLLIGTQIRAGYIIKNTTLVWNMECGKGQVLGFTTEAIGFMAGLENKISLKISLSNIQQCLGDMKAIGLPSSTLSTLQRLHEAHVEGNAVLVIHRDPGRYNFFTDSVDHPALIIGRSMYETDRIPSGWIEKCNRLVDRIWVPSSFNQDTFHKSGVTQGKLDVMPEPVDIFTYDPEIFTNNEKKKTEANSNLSLYSNVLTRRPSIFHLPNKKSFNFLSIMKWEKRKGWETLLGAYFEEFSSEDDVSLYIRANMDAKNEDEYEKLRESVSKSKNVKVEELPQVVFLKEQVPFSKLPSLYAAVDCVVLATHGEGWGLPIIEGMAMGLPTIATNWSGNTEFMKESNSFLIPVEEMVDAPTQGHLWAQPSQEYLKAIMRNVFENQEEGRAIGRRAREDVKQKYSEDKIAELVLTKLRHLLDNLDEITEERKTNVAQVSTFTEDLIEVASNWVKMKIVSE